MPHIEWVDINQLKPNPRNSRTHASKQVGQIAGSIKIAGFIVPVVADENLVILAGEGRLLAAKKLGLKKIPVVKAEGLSEAKKRAFLIADNKICENAGWDRKKLAKELPELRELLIEENLDIEITGFAAVEIDQLTVDLEENSADPADALEPHVLGGAPVTTLGDIWQLDDHLVECGDARDKEALRRLMGEREAAMAFLDLPYNRKVSDIVGRGRTKHAEFAMASGDFSLDEYSAFLKDGFSAAASVSRDGAVHFCCSDWRSVADLIGIGRTIYGEMLNLVVWVKSNGGMGTFYRSQHELVGVFRVGNVSHLNNVELGRHGRSRTNVWHYAGLSSFSSGRMEELRGHPTPKPVAMVCDAIKDCTRRNDIVLDTFCGSGTTLLAAERVGRRAVCVEIEPRFVDLTIRRWQAFTGRDAVHAQSGRCFDEIADDYDSGKTSAATVGGV